MVIHLVQKENWAQMWFLLQNCYFFFCSFRSGCWGRCGWVQRMLHPWPSACCPSPAQGMPWIPPAGTALWGCACPRNVVPVAEVLCAGSLLAASHSLSDCWRTTTSLGVFFLPLNLLMHRVCEALPSVLSTVSLTRDISSLEKSIRNSHRISWFFSIQHSQTLCFRKIRFTYLYVVIMLLIFLTWLWDCIKKSNINSCIASDYG